MEYFKRGLEAAEKMGAKKLLTNCIGAPFDEEYDRAYDRAVRSLKELSKTLQTTALPLQWKLCARKKAA